MVTKKWKQEIGPYALFFIFTCFFMLTTAFFPYSLRHLSFDSGAFTYVGMAMQKGLIPYIDAWDNKGPFLYFVNMVGISIHHTYGLFFVEFTCIFITNVFLYKAARFFSGKWVATLSSLYTILLLSTTLEGGNFCEQYSLPFMSISLYLMVKFFSYGWKLKKTEIVVIGLCIGATFLMRPNLLALPVAMAIVVITVMIRKKDWKKLKYIILWLTVGFLLILLPFVYYLAIHGALAACINAAYMTLSQFIRPSLLKSIQSLHSLVVKTNATNIYTLCFIFCVIFLYDHFKKESLKDEIKYPLWVCFYGLLMNLFMNALSGADYPHYAMTFIPLTVLPVAFLFDLFQKCNMQKNGHVAKRGWALFVMVTFLSYGGVVANTTRSLGNLREKKDLFHPMALLDYYITDHTQDGDLIQVIGGSVTSLYYHTKRFAASEYYYVPPETFTETFRKKAYQEIMKDVMEKQPKMILFPKQANIDEMNHFIDFPDLFVEFLNEKYERQDAPNYYIAYILR